MAFRGVTGLMPVGLAGLHGAKNPSQLSPAHLSYVEGVDLDGGLIRKDGGVISLNSVAFASDVVSGISWSPAADTYHDIILLNNGQVRRDTGSGEFSDILANGLFVNLEPPMSFVGAGGEATGATRKLFMFSANNQLRFVDGLGGVEVIESPPADWASNFPTFGVHHINRVWGGGNANDPHRLYASLPANHQDFAHNDCVQLAIYPGEGERLVGAVSFKGFLIVWKYPVGIYTVDTRDPVVSNWRVDVLSRAVGGVNAQTIFQIDNDIMFLDHAGNIHLISATNTLGDAETSDIGQAIELGKFVRDNISLARIRRSVGIWYPARRQAWIWMPQTASFENNLRLVVDRSDPEVGFRFFVSRRDSITCAYMRPDEDRIPRPVVGEGKNILRLDQEERNKLGAAYMMEFESANTDFSYLDPSLAYRVKNGQSLRIACDLLTQALLEVDVIWDDNLVDTLLFNFAPTGVPLGEFQLDVDALAASGTQGLTKRLPGSGHRLKLRVRSEGLDEDIAIAAFYVGFTVGDEYERSA